MAKPPPSEWGKLNAGQTYGVLAIDLGRAIFGVPWGKYELPILYRLIEHSWCPARTQGRRKAEADGASWPDPQPCPLNINALAAELGFPRQRLYEARDRLVAMNVLVGDEAGFWLNKNADEWVEPRTGEPMLGPKMISYALNGRRRRQKSDEQTSVTPQRDMHVTPQRDTMSRSSVTCTEPAPEACHAPALHDVTPQRDTMSRSSVTSPIEERAPESIKTGKRDNNIVPFAAPDAVQPAPPADDCPEYPTTDGALFMSPGRYPMDQGDARRVYRMIWRGFKDARLCNEFYEHQEWYPFDYWVAGIRQAKLMNVQVNSIHYIEKIVQGYMKKGSVPKVERAETIEIKPPPKQPVYYTRRSTEPLKFVPRDGTRG